LLGTVAEVLTMCCFFDKYWRGVGSYYKIRILSRSCFSEKATSLLTFTADAERALGDIAQALAALQEGLAIGERLAAALPEHEDYKNLARYFHARLHEVKTGALIGT
jgi:hypothetical protein